MDKPKSLVKNAIKKFNPMAGFVHILPKVGLKQPGSNAPKPNLIITLQ